MANVSIPITASSNLPEVLTEDEEALRRAAAAHEKAQKEIAKIIARGDPAKAAELQLQRQLAALERAGARSKDVVDQVEKAKADIIARYEKRKTELIEQEAKKQAEILERESKKQGEAILGLRKPVKDVTSLIARLGGEAGSAVGSVGKLGLGLASTFASGGLVALAIAGTGAAVATVASNIRETSKAAEEAKIAQVAAWRATTDEVRNANDELAKHLQMQERFYGLTTQGERNVVSAQVGFDQAAGNLAALDADKARLDQIGGPLAFQGKTEAEAKSLAAELKVLRERVGDYTEKRAELERIVRDAEYELERARAIADVEGQNRVDPRDPTAGIGRPSDGAKGGVRGAAAGPKGFGRLGEFRGAKMLAAEQAARDAAKLTGDDGSAFGLNIAKQVEEQRRLQEEMDRGAMDAARRAALLAKQSQADLANALAEADPFAAIDRRMQVALEAIEEKLKQARRLAADEASAPAALQAIENLEKQKTAVVEKAAREQSKKDGEMAIAGMQAAAAFGHGFKAYYESNDPRDLFKGILGAAAGIFAMAGMAPVGAGLGLVGGFFEDGGVPFSYAIPQGRRGLAVLPGVNNDAKPTWLHEQEVVLPRDVIADDLGGMPEAMRLAGGKGLPSRGRGGGVTVVNNYVSAWDSVDAMGAFSRQEGARVQRINSRQGGLEQAASMRWMQQPRHA